MANRKPETQQETKVDLDALVQRVNQLEDEVVSLKQLEEEIASLKATNIVLEKAIERFRADLGTSANSGSVSADIDFRELRGRVSKLERRLG